MFRLFSILFLGLALLLSPLSMARAGLAVHHSPAVESSQKGGHCTNEEAPSDEQESDPGLACSSACATFPSVQPSTWHHPLPPAPLLVQARHRLLAGIQPERETPPPRLAPEI